MTIVYPGGPHTDPNFTTLSEGQVPKADIFGKLIYSGATVDPSTLEWTFDTSINVPQASVKISDVVSISEATFALLIRDNVLSSNAHAASSEMVDGGSNPLNILVGTSKETVIAQPTFNTEFTANPFTAPLSATLTNQTDAVTVKAGSAMSNVRITIRDNLSDVIVKYIPNKAAVESGVGGLDFRAGDNRVDFNSTEPDNPGNGLFHLGHTPLRQFAGEASTFTLEADSVSLLGEPGGIPFFQNEIQFLLLKTVPYIEDITNVADNYTRLNTEYTATTGIPSGVLVNYEATSTLDTVAGDQFTAGVPSVSNPTVATNGTAFAQGDIIQISGTRLNDGIYEVEDHAPNLLTIRGVGTVDVVENFSNRDFITTVDSALIAKINVSVMRAGVDGLWEESKGSETGLVFTDIRHEAIGSMFEDNPTGTVIEDTGTYKGWVTASAGVFDNESIVTFLNDATADRLVIGSGGAGIYNIDFHVSFTNNGNQTTTAAVHKNGVEQSTIKASQRGQSVQRASISAAGHLVLSDGDYLDLRIISSANPSQTIYFTSLSISRISK